MSDMQCPATFLLLSPEAVVSELAEELRGERTALVYAWQQATDAASTLADTLDVPLEVLTTPAGLRAELRERADQHRGETVAVSLANGQPLQSAGELGTRLEVDADGERLTPWHATAW